MFPRLWLVIFAAGEAFVFEFLISEIDEQPHFEARRVEIIDDLGLVLGRDGLYGLQFQDHFALHQDVGEDSNVPPPLQWPVPSIFEGSHQRK